MRNTAPVTPHLVWIAVNALVAWGLLWVVGELIESLHTRGCANMVKFPVVAGLVTCIRPRGVSGVTIVAMLMLSSAEAGPEAGPTARTLTKGFAILTMVATAIVELIAWSVCAVQVRMAGAAAGREGGEEG